MLQIDFDYYGVRSPRIRASTSKCERSTSVYRASCCLSLMRTGSENHLQYELLRSQSTLEKQGTLLTTLEVPMPPKPATKGKVLTLPERALRALLTLQRIATSFEEKAAAGGSNGLSVTGIMKVIAKEVEVNGLGSRRGREIEEPVYVLLPVLCIHIHGHVLSRRRSDSNADLGFVKWACSDGLALLS